MKTLKEAFKELAKRRLWYINSNRTPAIAKYDKYRFNKGVYITEERLREYLSSAGWICKQEEMWEEQNNE